MITRASHDQDTCHTLTVFVVGWKNQLQELSTSCNKNKTQLPQKTLMHDCHTYLNSPISFHQRAPSRHIEDPLQDDHYQVRGVTSPPASSCEL
jgi:hypothetical protein